MPLTLFGTMGAIIRMRGGIPDRRKLFDIGVAGPLAGLLPALLACAYGLRHSQLIPVQGLEAPGMAHLGSSVLFSSLVHLFVGPVPEGREILLHPVAFAGWAGLFVTALNLIPVGQLDGGHIGYALLGWRSRWLGLAAFAAFAYIALFHFHGWVLMLALIWIFGLRHPPTEDPVTELGWGRRLLGWFALAICLLAFPPVPLQF